MRNPNPEKASINLGRSAEVKESLRGCEGRFCSDLVGCAGNRSRGVLEAEDRR